MKLLALALLLGLVGAAVAQPNERDQKMAWWREARFGLFIHWGLYAIPAGKWGDKTHYGEWIRETAQIPRATYHEFQKQWNPTNFNADTWMGLAAEAGMKYVVITTKHHDGFCLFPSDQTDWDVEGTSDRRDIMAAIAQSARKNGLVPGWYHSIMDWNHPDYLPRRSWEKDWSPDGADMDRYEKYLHAQVTELLTRYGDIGVMWFDGEWESTWNRERGRRLYDLCKRLQPNILVNNRVDVGRGGMAGMTQPGYLGDFGTPEQEVPDEGFPDTDWESCITMNRNWGFNAADKDFKSTRELLELLVDVVSKGGNLLLNVGPKADGSIPEELVIRLKEMGTWMKVNGEAIHGTTASAFRNPKGWKSTTKGNVVYVIVHDRQTGEVRVPGMANQVRSARWLGGSTATARQDGPTRIFPLSEAPQGDLPVLRLELDGPPKVYEAPLFANETTEFVNSLPVTLKGALDVRYTTDGSEPTANSQLYFGPFHLSKSTTVKAAAFHGDKRVSDVISQVFKQVDPRPAVEAETVPGLRVDFFRGRFSRCEDMTSLYESSFVDAPDIAHMPKGEDIGARIRGYIWVDQDDLYEIRLTSDDGSRLFLGDDLLIDNDGLHSSVTKNAFVALKKGLHRIRLEWFNASGAAALSLEVIGRERGGKAAYRR